MINLFFFITKSNAELVFIFKSHQVSSSVGVGTIDVQKQKILSA